MSGANKKLTHADLIKILGHAMHDDAFKAKVLSHPKDVLDEGGFASDDKTLKFFDSLTKNKLDDAARRATEHHTKDAIDFAGDL